MKPSFLISVLLFFSCCKAPDQHQAEINELQTGQSKKKYDMDRLPPDHCIVEAKLIKEDNETFSFLIEQIYECSNSSSRHKLNQNHSLKTSTLDFNPESGKIYKMLILVASESTHIEIVEIFN